MANNISSCTLYGKYTMCNLAGDTFYYQDGNFHREDGPAIETNSGEDKWYYYGELIPVNSQQDFERYLQLYILI